MSKYVFNLLFSLQFFRINRLDRHAILIGAEPSLPLNIIKKHQKMLRPGYKVICLTNLTLVLNFYLGSRQRQITFNDR